MVERTDSGGTSYQFIWDPTGNNLAWMSGGSLFWGMVPLPRGAEARFDSSGGVVFYGHPDWLGSRRFTSLPSGTNRFRCSQAYAPYGEQYSSAGTADCNAFTGANQNEITGNTGFNDFEFRKYMPVQGRWISPDPLGAGAADPGNPQSWNRYGYVSGRPDVLTDPSGLCEICAPPVDPITIAVDVVGAIFSLFGIFGGGSSGPPIQAATHQMIHRANSGTIWSESNGLPAGMAVPQPSIAGMLGVPSVPGSTCDFCPGVGTTADPLAPAIAVPLAIPTGIGQAIAAVAIGVAALVSLAVAANQAAEAIRGAHCAEQYERDIETCRKVSGKASRQACYSQAMEVRIACEQGKYVPFPWGGRY